MHSGCLIVDMLLFSLLALLSVSAEIRRWPELSGTNLGWLVGN